jgi:hypothetical protein
MWQLVLQSDQATKLLISSYLPETLRIRRKPPLQLIANQLKSIGADGKPVVIFSTLLCELRHRARAIPGAELK